MNLIRKSLVGVILLTSMISCSKDNEPYDELLSGTQWDNKVRPYLGHDEDEHSFVHTYTYVSKYFPEINYDLGNFFTAQEHDTIPLSEDNSCLVLDFGGNDCLATFKAYDALQVNTYDVRQRICTYQPGTSYNAGLDVTCIVREDGIYTQKGYEAEKKLYDLDRFDARESYSKKFAKSHVADITKACTKMSLSYSREGKEILMSNDSVRWIGQIGESYSSLDIIQILPVWKEIGKLRLPER